MSAAVEVTLPGGFARDGVWQRSIWLRPWNGSDELYLEEAASGLPPAVRATVLLARCAALAPHAEPVGPAFVRCLTAGDREALLLHLRRITLGDAVSCVLTCPSCADRLDLDLSITALLLPPYPHAAEAHKAHFGAGRSAATVCFRLPNGEDQEQAAFLVASDPERAASELLERCIRSVEDAEAHPLSELPLMVSEALPARMAELDAQAELLLGAECPHCGAQFQALLDASQYVLQEMERACEQLLRQVHLLAFHYHWTESDILAMAGSRRRRYLGLLADALGGGRAA